MIELYLAEVHLAELHRQRQATRDMNHARNVAEESSATPASENHSDLSLLKRSWRRARAA